MVTRGFIVQLAATLLLSLMNFCSGFSMVWPSYSLRYYEANPASLGGTYQPHHGNLVGSLSMLGSSIATLFSGALADLVGRKKGELICGLVCLSSWVLTCTAKSINIVIVARFLVGLSVGLNFGIQNIFISEFVEVSSRGRLMCIITFMYTSGILGSYIIGWLCSYEVANYIILTLALVFTFGIFMLKESPAYLLKNGKDNEALESLKFYRGTKQNSHEVLDELSNLKHLIRTPNEMVQVERKNYHIEDPEQEKLKQQVEELFTPKPKVNAWQALCASKSSQRGLVICSILVVLEVSVGTGAVQTYAGPLFLQAVPSLSPDMCSVALALANMLGSAAPLWLSDSLGRRTLMITSSILVSTCLFTIGALLRWSFAPDWIVPVVMLLYFFCFQIGIACMPFVLISECFLPEVKSLCTTISLCLMWMGYFIVLAVFRPMVSLIGLDGAFFVFTTIAVANSCISYVMVPETAGLSMEAVQVLLSKGYVQIKRPRSLER